MKRVATEHVCAASCSLCRMEVVRVAEAMMRALEQSMASAAAEVGEEERREMAQEMERLGFLLDEKRAEARR